MKRNNILRITTILLILVLTMITACGAPEGEETLDETQLTLEYLKGDYTSQLLTDGAEHLVGSIEFSTAEDGSVQLILHPKEVSASANSDGTYTVTSYVINRVLSVSDSLYATYIDSSSILSAFEFELAVQDDYEAQGVSFDEYGDHILYDVYALEDQVLLALYNPSYVLPQPEAK